MTFDEFIARKFPNNSYVDFPEFSSLYLRKGKVYVTLDDEFTYIENIITVAAIEAENPGNGAWTRLVEFLTNRNYAIFVECVHNTRFGNKLLQMGFKKVNEHTGDHYLLNHKK